MYLNPGDSIAEMTSSAPKQAPKTATAVAEKPAKAATTTTAAVSTDDDLDSFLNDLDI